MEYLERIKKEIKERILRRQNTNDDAQLGLCQTLMEATEKEVNAQIGACLSVMATEQSQTTELLKIQVEQNARIIRLLETKR